jgi:hypothetical protein
MAFGWGRVKAHPFLHLVCLNINDDIPILILGHTVFLHCIGKGVSLSHKLQLEGKYQIKPRHF